MEIPLIETEHIFFLVFILVFFKVFLLGLKLKEINTNQYKYHLPVSAPQRARMIIESSMWTWVGKKRSLGII